MALQDEQQIRTASSDNQSLVTANIHSDRLPRSSLQPTALDATALQEKYPIERQEEFKMQVLKDPKCGPTWNGLEEQGGLVGSPGRAQSSSIPTVSSHQHKALGSPCYSHLRRQRASTVYHGILISVCLCLQMPIVAAALQAQGPCHRMMDILDGKADLFCKLNNCTFKNGRKVEDAESINMIIKIVVFAVLVIILILIGLSIKRNELKNFFKNRSSKSQPSPSQAIQSPYVPTPNTDPADDDLHSIATDGSADIAATHDSISGETSASPTEDPYPSGTATVDTSLTADSESMPMIPRPVTPESICDSYDSISLGAEACGTDVTVFLAAEVKNKLLSKHDSQKQVEMQVFAVNRQV
ncbi:hypothetical protein HJG60_011300 [Phyllostomus discolor]|uniref:Uncharacterized protein n=1 Tax=Phyllostomus discolor TaxID=89673 RepID=A0A833ZXF9_9CHIR|nr:hypothetical protein HJG60_011300 [Phyllostomus discolor]